MQLRGKVPPQKEVVLEFLAERYGWGYNEIKCIPDSEMTAILQIMKTKDILREKDNQSKMRR